MRKIDPLKLLLLPLIPALGLGIVEVAKRIDLGFTDDTSEPAVAIAPTEAPPLPPPPPCIDCGTDA